VTFSSFAVPADRRYFEDYEAGRVYEFGTISVSEQEIIDLRGASIPSIFI
jgi:hypothetical protein